MDTNEILTLLLVMGVIGWVTLNIVYPMNAATEGGWILFQILPQDLHKNTKMNWVGCILVSIVLFVVLTPTWIGRFLYWAFHVGRKEKSNQ